PREELAVAGPVDDLSPGHPPGADDELGRVRTLRTGEEVEQLLGPVRAVGVLLYYELVAPLERPLEAGHVRMSQSLLARAVQDVEAVVTGRCRVGDRAGAVGAVVVGDEDVGVRDGLPGALQRGRERLTLVVGRDDDESPHAVLLGRRDR